ncbi:hypothetical protein ABZS77_02405 [Micromonospora sp. NPDC005298]
MPSRLSRGLLHGLVVTALLVLGVATVASVRLRRRRHLRHLPVG